jgi:hypothetical protein
MKSPGADGEGFEEADGEGFEEADREGFEEAGEGGCIGPGHVVLA